MQNKHLYRGRDMCPEVSLQSVQKWVKIGMSVDILVGGVTFARIANTSEGQASVTTLDGVLYEGSVPNCVDELNTVLQVDRGKISTAKRLPSPIQQQTTHTEASV